MLAAWMAKFVSHHLISLNMTKISQQRQEELLLTVNCNNFTDSLTSSSNIIVIKYLQILDISIILKKQEASRKRDYHRAYNYEAKWQKVS